MKKKLLTVLLAVVMVFGVFGLTACGGKTNPDEEYNYYGMKYSIEGEVKIEAATYQGVYRMFTTSGKFLLYVDSEGEGAAARFQAINKLANDWNVTIYHFNPDLTGGYEADNVDAHTANIIEELDTVAAASQMQAVQDNLSAISRDSEVYSNKKDQAKDKATDIPDNSLLGISGAAPTYEIDGTSVKTSYSGSYVDRAWNDDVEEAIMSIATRKPSYGAYTDAAKDIPNTPDAYNTSNISTMNLFADARLHMYDEAGDLTAEKEDVFVTVANYAMFAHLMDNNQGYFSVFFGGTWCGNTQAIAKACNDLAKDYGIAKIYFFDPRLDDGTKLDKAEAIYVNDVDPKTGMIKKEVKVTANNDYLAKNLNTRTAEGSGDAYCYSYTYGKFVTDYLTTYSSEWNIRNTAYDPDSEVRTIAVQFDGAKHDVTRMCVPNIMMFNGEGEGKAALVKFAEAEYSWANVNTEGDAQQVEWDAAVKAIFDENPYAKYAPIVVATATPEASAPATSAPAAGGGDAC